VRKSLGAVTLIIRIAEKWFEITNNAVTRGRGYKIGIVLVLHFNRWVEASAGGL
jgi:hypothetical protein